MGSSPPDGERGRGGQPGGSGRVCGVLGCQAASKPARIGEKKKKGREEGGRGEPCRCDKLKISTAACGDAPRGLCSRRGFCLAAACRRRHDVVARFRHVLRLRRSSAAGALATAHGRLSPRRPPASLAGPRQPFQLHPLISGSRLAASSLPEILQLLSALAQTRLPHARTVAEQRRVGTGSPAAARPAAIPGQAARAMRGTGTVRVSS